MSDNTATRNEVEEVIIKQAISNKGYRALLIANPRDMVERQIGQKLPENVQVELVQEAANKIVLRLPHVVAEGDQLADEDLEQVAGGKLDKVTCSGGNTAGAFITKNEIKLA
jgi:hypothetical protein